MKAGIINVTGYAGSELARILDGHPEVEVASVTGRSAAGKRLPEVFPHLWRLDLPITRTVDDSVDIVFSALPSGASAETLAPLVDGGVKAVDIAADFRLRDPAMFRLAYKTEHPAPHLLEKAVYGLPELHRELIRQTSLVANPGCFPEASLLAMAPAVREGLVVDDVIVDAKSGISGAGRGGLATDVKDHYAEANENVLAYGLDGHGHQPEIAQELAGLREAETARVTFIPHRVPMTRGIMATCYAPLRDESLDKEAVREVYKRLLRERALRAGRRRTASDEADRGLQHVPGVPGGGPAGGQASGGELHRQPGQGGRGPGGPEHEPHVRPAGTGGPGPARGLSLRSRATGYRRAFGARIGL